MAALVEVEKIDHHALVVLNRPEKLNALSYDLIDTLMTHLDALEADDTVRCLVIMGQGSRAFSAGADIAGFAPDIALSPEMAWRRFASRGQAMTRRIENYPKPVIAAVNGIAYGGGCEIVEACCLAIAADHATFAKPEIRLGFAPPFGGTQRLPRHIGRKRALEMILTAEPITARAALDMGLVNQLTAGQDLLTRCIELADRIAEQPAGAVAAALRAVTRGLNVSMDEGLAIEAAQFMLAAATPDARLRVQAFLEKRHQAGAGV